MSQWGQCSIVTGVMLTQECGWKDGGRGGPLRQSQDGTRTVLDSDRPSPGRRLLSQYGVNECNRILRHLTKRLSARIHLEPRETTPVSPWLGHDGEVSQILNAAFYPCFAEIGVRAHGYTHCDGANGAFMPEAQRRIRLHGNETSQASAWRTPYQQHSRHRYNQHSALPTDLSG
jgi:hypothetical protein